MKNLAPWQSIEMLPVVEGQLHETLTEAENQLKYLEGMKHHPTILDDTAFERLMQTYEAQANQLPFLKTQVLRWRQTDYLTERQVTLLDSVDHALTLSEKVIQKILELAQHFLHGTMETLVIEENKTWMQAILAGEADVPESFKEELALLKAESDYLTSAEQQLIVTIHTQVRTLQAENVSKETLIVTLNPYFPAIKTLLTQNKHNALLYYCCLYPGFNEAMQLLATVDATIDV